MLFTQNFFDVVNGMYNDFDVGSKLVALLLYFI